ncbi:MAG: hypothetical protein ACI8S6_000032 [Myxococcota bacterium]|jgi:hypothetical protein
MMTLILFSCARSTLQASPSAEVGSAEASQSARPDWSREHGYAPGLEQGQLEGFERTAHSGPLQGALLLCEAQTRHRGDRARALAARRGVDTSLPDMNAWLYVDELGVRTAGPQDSDQTLLSAPSMRLERGDTVQIVLQDRGFFRQVTFDTLHGTYTGALPLELAGAKSTASCWRASSAQLAAALQEALSGADEALRRLDAREVVLEERDFGRELSPDPREALEPAAGLVGWAHPALVSRLERIDVAEEAFTAALASAVSDETHMLSDEVSVDGSELRLRQSVCPRPLGYWRHRMEAECVVELDVSVGSEELPPMDVVFEDGTHWPAYFWSVPDDAHALTAASAGALSPSSEGTMMVRYSRDQEPIAVRIRGSEGLRWLPLSDRD